MKQTFIYTAALAALMLIPTACSDELPDSGRNPEKQPGEAGPLITVTATQDSRPQTRLGYDVPESNTEPIAVTWAAGDKFYVGKDWSALNGTETFISNAPNYFFHFNLKGEGGSKSAEFEGILSSEVQNGDPLYAFYGDGENRIVLDKEGKGALFFWYTNQRQSADNKTDHLSAADFMAATTTYETDKQPVFAFTHLGAMIKFNLTLPTGVQAVKELTLTTTDGSKPFSTVAQWDKAKALAFSKTQTASASTTLLLGEDEFGITLTDTKLTAYMMVAPTTLTGVVMKDKKLLLKVTDASGVVYAATLTGADLEQGKYYTVQAALVQLFNEMKFQIKVEGDNLTFKIPFDISKRAPADITVNWGDGETVTVTKGTYLSQTTDFAHPYKNDGTYTITITSSQIDATQQQIPIFRFSYDDENSSNAKKLIRMNTPMLNTGESSFANCFKGCANLKDLPTGLFDKNTQVTRFDGCFDGCTNLASLPTGLFDKHTEVTDFTYCFNNCTNLASLPPGLFDKNINATAFSSCFENCTNLVLNDKIFYSVENLNRFKDKTMLFLHCFEETGSALTNEQQEKSVAPRLWEYNNGTAPWRTTDCYTDCKASNLEDVPDTNKWGTPASAPDKGSSLVDRDNITWK